ncbi:MAG: GTPase ObgE, partial [Candidatus Aminicenantes bacterium]|nr:GTPase ObgE [Candidatus Aminicenantes bacterium]
PMNKAKNGAPGEGGNRTGKRGEDLTLLVPVGTVVRERDGEKTLFDFVAPGLVFVAVRGGKGGRGNASYATSTHQAPREHEPGRPGEERELVLELKLIADVGLVGFPNAGKSTLISRITAARPVIAAYPFTTLIPHLGVVDLGEFRSFVVADIPGLIEGAHAGHGLGVRFLKHIERTRLLVHLVDVSPHTGRDPVRDFEVVQAELAAFRPPLDGRPQILAANKIDLLAGETNRLEALRELARSRKIPFFPISALTADGLKPLLRAVARMLESLRREADEERT